jgi:subtilisin family serine protease
VPALLLGTLAACGGGGGGVATLSEYRHWLGSRLQTDQSLNQQSSYALRNSNVLSAHAKGFKGKGVTVAVIDSEVDLTHPDLRNRWMRDSNGKVTGYNSVEQHSDVRPVVQRRDKPRSDISEPDIANQIRAAETTHGISFTRSISHGTHVAGIIAASDNEFGTVGVAPEASILPVTLFREFYSRRARTRPQGSDPTRIDSAGWNNEVARAVDYAASKSPFVLNNSWGSTWAFEITRGTNRPENERTYYNLFNYFLGNQQHADIFQKPARDAWLRVANKDMVVVFAAGNDGWNSETGRIPVYATKYSADNRYTDEPIDYFTSIGRVIDGQNIPSNIPNLESSYFLTDGAFVGKWLAVVNLDENNRIYRTSNGCGIAKEYCLGANGVNIRSTGVLEDKDTKNGYVNYGGTSMAAPMVSGALAVLKGKDPQLTAKQAVQIILDTATDLGAPGVDDVYGHGLLNLAKALEPVGAASGAGRDANALSGFDPRQNAVAFSTAFGNGAARQALTSGVFDKYNRSYQMKTPLQAPIRKAPSLDALIQFHHGKISAASRTVALTSDGSLFYSMSDNRYGQRGKGVSFDMFGDVQGTHYRTHLSFTKTQIADTMMPSSTNKSLWSGLGSHSRDHMQGRFDTALHDNMWLGIYTGRGQLGGTGTTTRTDRADDHGTYRFDDVGIALTHQDRTTRISLSAGRFFELGRFLASRSEGAFQLDKATRSDYLHLGAAASLSPRIGISADYMKVNTKVDFRHNAYVDDMTLDADSADARLTVTDVIADNDHFAIGYRLPLAVRHGAMTQHSVKGYDAAGNYHVAVDRIDFAVSKRHRIAHVTYVRQLKARSRGDAAFRWFVEGATHHNWGNMAGQKNRQINTGLIASF